MSNDKIINPPIDPNNPNHHPAMLDVDQSIVPETIINTLPGDERRAIRKQQKKLLGKRAEGKRSRGAGELTKTDRAVARHQRKIGMADLLADHVASGEEYQDTSPPPDDFGQYDPESLEVSEITKYCPMVQFNVSSRFAVNKKYQFYSCVGFRGLMIPLKVAPVAFIPDRRLITHAWFKTPTELKGESEVRGLARAIVQAYEDIQATKPDKSAIAKPTTKMRAFNIASKLSASKRYHFLTLPDWKGLWAKNLVFNRDGQHAPDAEFKDYFAVDKSIYGREAIRLKAMKMVGEFEGVEVGTERIRNERRGTNHSIYLREEDDANLKTLEDYFKAKGLPGGKSRAVQVALKLAVDKVERKEEIDINE